MPTDEETAVLQSIIDYNAAAAVRTIKGLPTWVMPITGERVPRLHTEAEAQEILLECGMTREQIENEGYGLVFVLDVVDVSFTNEPRMRFVWASWGIVPDLHKRVDLILSEGELV